MKKRRSERPRRRQPSDPGGAPKAPKRRSRRPARLLPALVAALVALVAGVLALVIWARSAGPGPGNRHLFEVPQAPEPGELAAQLSALGVVESPLLFRLYFGFLGPPALPGEHLLRDDLSPRELAQRLGRAPGRASRAVLIPEGYHHAQIGKRLEELEITSLAAFRRAVFDPRLLAELGLAGSAEGYLFPATYELRLDSDAESVVRTLVAEAKKRLAKLQSAHPGAFERLEREHGFGERDLLTLASIVERETGDPAELPLIAGVFFNRLKDRDFRPLRSLQSDPTAVYGCLVEPERAPSCQGFRGSVTPRMLRDPENRYNTYRHPGLPPGPIANPGERALAAVLAPATTEYLYFFATGRGKHAFSRTFEEHRRHIEGTKR